MKNENTVLLIGGIVGVVAVTAALLYMVDDSIRAGRHVMVSTDLITIEFNRNC